MTHYKVLDYERVAQPEPEIVIYRLSGKMLGTKECYQFLENVRDDVHAGRARVMINLGKVERLSSAGVGILAACYTSVTNARGRVCLIDVPEAVRTLLKIVLLWDLLPHFATEEEGHTHLAAG